MSFAKRQSITVVTDGSGNATAFFPVTTGKITNVIYIADGSIPYTNTVDFTITVESTGQNVWVESNVAASKVCAPRQATHGTDGTASLYAAAGTAVQDKIAIADDRVKVALVQGGAAKSGQFILVVE